MTVIKNLGRHTSGARKALRRQCTRAERILDTRRQAQDGDTRNVINARRTGNTETRAASGYHPR
jgi:hypothetical protein